MSKERDELEIPEPNRADLPQIFTEKPRSQLEKLASRLKVLTNSWHLSRPVGLPPWEPPFPATFIIPEVEKEEAKDFYQTFKEGLELTDPKAYSLYFTDGSKGTGKLGPSTANAYVKLGTKSSVLAIKGFNSGFYLTIADAEVEGIFNALSHFKSTYNGEKKLFICADSQAAIKRLKMQDGDKRALETKRLALSITSSGVSITLRWVPSHLGIEGNELADKVAKEALSLRELKTPLVPISYLKLIN